ILAGLFQHGDRIGVDPLTYPGIKTAAKMLGIQLIPIKQEDKEISEEGLLYACKNENIKGLYIIPDYQNPTTHIMSQNGRKM
ncbi:PLP-dependent aminotransferase family protein, partial [Clostridioides difficile]|nr:PLP-dependent aminotransferase family protein [Clostridioides difficile]